MATLFYHPSGDDSAAGTLNAPRKSLNSLGSGASVANNATTRFGLGDTILLARGGIWVPEAVNMNVRFMFDPSCSVHSGQYIGSYTADLGDDQPILDPILYDDGTGWTYLATGNSGRWEKTYLSTDGIALSARCWPALTGPSSPRNYDSMRYRSSAAALTQEYDYNVLGLVATVYTGSATINPFQYYGGIAFQRRTFGSIASLGRLRAMSGESWRDGVTFRSTLSLQSGASSVVLDGFRLECMSGVGLNINEGGYISKNIYIPNLSYDYYTGVHENEADSSRFGGWNAVSISPAPTSGTNGCFGIDIVDMNGRGARHLGVQLVNGSATYLNGVSGITVRATRKGRSVFDSRDIDYGRAFGSICSGALFKDLIFTNNVTQCQMSGIGRIENCDWINNRFFASQPNNEGTDNCLGTGSPYNDLYAGDINPYTSIDVVGCLFENPTNFAHAHSDSTGVGTTPTQPGDIRFVNNTIVDLLHYTERRTIQNVPVYPLPGACVVIYSYTAGNPPFFTYKNNVYILPEGATTVYLHKNSATGTGPIGAFKCVPYTVNDPTAPTVPVANQQHASLSAAGLGPTYLVENDASPLIAAGVHAGYNADPTGVQRWNPPTVGRYEYQRERVPLV